MVPFVITLDDNMSGVESIFPKPFSRGNGCQIYAGYTHWYGRPASGNGWGSGCGYIMLEHSTQVGADKEDWFFPAKPT